MKRISQLLLPLALLGSMALHAQSYPGYEISVEPLGSQVNSSGNDYAPFVTGTEASLYFTSSRRGNSRADVMKTQQIGNGWATATTADASFNTSGDDGALAIAADGRTVAFASERSGGEGDGDIYIGELTNGQLINIRNLGGVVNTKYWESQPAISGDGRTIYFTSNRPGGFGSTDIWMTTRNDSGVWSKPSNLGPSVNTGKDERSPYLTPDGGTLYFSSNRPDSYGGYDIFMSNRIDGAWTQPHNLGRPINSDDDELFFFAPRAWDRFFLASNRGGQGGYDLFAGTPNVYADGMFHLNISIRDSLSGDPLSGVVTVIDRQTGNSVAFISTSILGGEYSQPLPAGRDYVVVAQVPGYANKQIAVVSPEANASKDAAFAFSATTISQFDLGRYSVPFFVTGYYRPNTRQALENLMTDLNSSLSEATYIERFPRNSQRYTLYQKYAGLVDSLFESVYRSGVNEIFPRFASDSRSDEIIEIVITGYADPQPFVGQYLEDGEHTFSDMSGAAYTVEHGNRITNMELSGLRASYSGQLLDQMFSSAVSTGRPEYTRLKNEGRIVYHFIAGGVSTNANDYAVQRRIHISINRRQRGVLANSTAPIMFDSNPGHSR